MFLALAFMSCEDEATNSNNEENQIEATILGRWIIEGFEDNIRYEFTADRLFTIYGENGEFPTLEEFQTENPQLTGNEWTYEGNTVVIDLNFGNFSRLVPEFKCGNYVAFMNQEDGSSHSTYYREGYNLADCNE